MRLWSNPKYVTLTPALTRGGFTIANIGQIAAMITMKSSKGQSIFAWLIILACGCLMFNFYRVCTPKEKVARWAQGIMLFEYLAVLLVVIWYRA